VLGDETGAGCQSDGLMSVHAGNHNSYLSSYTAATYEYGTARCPWHITAAPGRNIQLHVLDLSLSARYRAVWSQDVDGQHVSMEYCHVYATVRELSREGASAAGDTPICASDARETLVYTSHTNSVIVQVSAHAVEDPSANFLLRFRGTDILL